jgi:acetyl esterase/lipase
VGASTRSDLSNLFAHIAEVSHIFPANHNSTVLGKAYADKLKKDGVKVDYKEYSGVTHEFFGMGAVVPKARDAEQFAADGLKKAFTEKH